VRIGAETENGRDGGPGTGTKWVDLVDESEDGGDDASPTVSTRGGVDGGGGVGFITVIDGGGL
jgi:hypothetical protein